MPGVVKANNPYVALRIGMEKLERSALGVKEEDVVPLAGISIGTYLSNDVRVELAADYRDKAELMPVILLASGDVYNVENQSHTLIANMYYDIPTNTRIQPFVGACFGVAYNDVTIGPLSDDCFDFAWNIGGGFSVQANENVSVDVGYRYVDFGKSQFKGYDVDSDSHEIYAGFRCHF